MNGISPTIVLTDHSFPDVEIERAILREAGCDLSVAQCRTADEVAMAVADADVIMVQWAPITAEVIGGLRRCRGIVRIGIGIDNVDVDAARVQGIPVCNVPDYAIDEVADHTLAMALCLARQLPAIDARLRAGVWQITPPSPMPAFRNMNFVVIGMGRIGRAVLQRACDFKFKLAGCDPMLSDQDFAEAGVRRVTLDEAFEQADILSLHLPLTPQTAHVASPERLGKMKSNAILINTSRGGLVDTLALAEALQRGQIAAAGIDVYEEEPLPSDHPLRTCNGALLSSHVAWYSETSIFQLRNLAASEAARAACGEPLRNIVNGVAGESACV